MQLRKRDLRHPGRLPPHHRTSDQEGSTGLFVQIMIYKFGSKIADVEDGLNEFLELVRRYDEAIGTDPVPDQVRKACFRTRLSL